MKHSRVILVIVLLIVAAGVGFFVGRHHSKGGEEKEAATTEPAEEDKSVATVSVATVGQGEIADSMIAYGSVIADPGEVRIISAPFESRVVRVLATAAQQTTPDTEVVTVEASPDTKLALQDARNAVDAAKRDLQQIQQRFEQHLATNQELSQAQQALTAANLKLQSMLNRGVDKEQHLKSPMAGVVSKVDVQEGQIVPAGGPLIEIAARNRLQVKLGVEPADARVLKPGEPVTLRPVESTSGHEFEGHIRVVGDRVDQATRLVDVLVSLLPDAKLMLDNYMIGQLPRATVHGLIVPRQALLSEQDGFSVFTVKEGHAYEHDVKVTAQNEQDAAIESDDVKAGDQVALVGSLELEDKMAVQVKEPSTEASTEPTTAATTESAEKNQEKP